MRLASLSAALQSKPTGWVGFLLVTAGIMVPPTVHLIFPHLAPDFVEALHHWGDYAAWFGGAAALVGGSALQKTGGGASKG